MFKAAFGSQSNKNFTVFGLLNNRPRIMSIWNKRYPYYPEVILGLEDLAQVEIERTIHHRNATLFLVVRVKFRMFQKAPKNPSG